LVVSILGNDSHQLCSAFTLSMSTPSFKGSAAKPYEKKKVAVFGAGGYLGGCIYGFLQRAGSLYGTGIAGTGGSPRAIVATSAGSVSHNSVLSKNFVLAQADETFVKLTNMTSIPSIQSRLSGFDAAILATKCTLESRPVTLGSYESSPNDKTMEFYMERTRRDSVKGIDDSGYCFQLFERIVQACKAEGLSQLVVVETDSQFDDESNDSPVGGKYLDLLEGSGVPFTYIRPVGKFENYKDYTYVKGIQCDLKVSRATSLDEFKSASSGKMLYREDIAALCVQALLSLDWNENKVLQVEPAASFENKNDSNQKKAIPQREWCMNSEVLQVSLSGLT
jgi:hypothetical protein